jgi:hypothetical protein
VSHQAAPEGTVMPHEFDISSQLTLVSVIGLMPPLRSPDACVLKWTLDGRRRPDFFRWSWHPIAGHLVAGTVHHHVDQIPQDATRPFPSWLRGFVFCAEKQIAVRPFFWPLDAYDDWEAAHAKLAKTVYTAFYDLLKPKLRGYRFAHPVDNRWLLQNYSRYSRRW